MNNYERIKTMTIDEMVDLLDESDCMHCAYDDDTIKCRGLSCFKGIQQWLLSEVTND